MENLSERRREILDRIIETYIKTAEPVSSKFLEEKYDFGICPATIRIEMQRLMDDGFIYQPYTSAGRVPTDKGYRFYVDNMKLKSKNRELRIEEEINDSFRFFQNLTKRIAELTSNLALTYFPEEDVFFKEGWNSIFKEPEFEDPGLVSKFAEMVENMEKEIGEFEEIDSPQIFIGRENQLPGTQEFSTIISKIHLLEDKEGMLVILGPKRMDYNKNVGLVRSLNKLWQKKKTKK